VCYQPKPYDPAVTAPDADPEKIRRMADPALKESALLNNVFNRFARGCFYAAQKHLEGNLPFGEPSADAHMLARHAILEYEKAMAHFEFWRVMTVVDTFLREVAKRWNDGSKACERLENEQEGASAAQIHEAWQKLLIDAFYLLRIATMLVEPIAPGGCRMIIDFLDLCDAETFLSWEHILDFSLETFASDAEKSTGLHPIKELPPRTDFFPKHPSQFA